MRLHRLDITAFGPFAGTQRVDFDELSAAGLFLLHGPTGAGKTSVLDAVCYALYGQVPGARPATRLRSDHAASGTPTEVVLELTVGGRRLEITRRPEQLRAKRRGTGTTTDKAVTLLREHTGGRWQGLSKSHQEIGEEIRQLLGMSCEQFCQVVLLPQGEFATFLRASAVERAALLGRLFDTRRFRAVEHWLRDRRQEAQRALDAGDEELRQLAARMRQAAGETGDASGRTGAGGAEDDLAEALLTEAALLRVDARERDTIARAALAAAEKDHRAASRAAEAARDLDALQRRHREAERRAAALALEEPARTAARARLDSAHRALTVEPALSLRDKAAAQHADSLAARSAATRALDSAGELPPPAATVPQARAETQQPAAMDAGGPQVPLQAAERAAKERASTARAGISAQDADGWGPATERPSRAGTLGDRAAEAPAGDTGEGADEPDHVAGRPTDAGTLPDQPRSFAAGDTGEGVDARGEDAGQASEGSADWTGRTPRSVEDADASGGAAAADAQAAADRPGSGSGSTGVSGSSSDASATDEASALAGRLARRVAEVREELGGLAAAEEAEARLAEVGRRRREVERDAHDDEGAVREAQAWLERWPRERARLQERLDAGAEAAARAAALGAEAEVARARSVAAAERDDLAERLARAEEAARAAKDRAQDARQAWLDAREARISGIAAELAAELVDGSPCRVCGAEEHPAPAHPAGQHVTRADEEMALAVYQRAQAVHDEACEEASRLAAAHEGALARAGEAPRRELAEAARESAARHAEAERAAADVPEARRALARAEEERDRRSAQREQARSRAAARTSRREELDSQYAQLTEEVARARAGHPSAQARRGRLAARIALLERAVEAVREQADNAVRLAEAEAALSAAAASAGFAGPEEAEAALLPSGELRGLEQQVAAWAKEEVAVAAELGAEEPAAAAALPPADLAAAQQAQTATERRLRDASAAASAAAARCRELDRLGAKATARVRRLAPARDELRRLKRLSDLASGTSAENAYRMELETYVLAARLEQVAAAAAVRLERMSAGRYTLVHTDARTGGRGKSGLGLMVVDAWTGTERDTATLSGGETFFASLALALGLADVVTDEAGGTRLDTLFVDEGFGSLDEQTLDEVLDVLDGLRERDRAVGIVSHVADLRHRIPAQLRLVKGRDGSTVRMRGTAGTS
ncbi:AAA family ATPase [Actinacidiphila guanduensis]|uniref:Nuclease SbcCD subunit C n=1 Tax=Actinacidiphila guanduensis TaxID=310781 RepID=A0A1H0N1K7_9ACTN|nr:SMC family ATPase [Actinacidiphila guanduensis]SDO86547.1 exonuclease SbcC [Actinacidiphila guanduensis]